MGILRRLFGGGEQPPDRPRTASWDQRTSWLYNGTEVHLCEGQVDLEVVGEASYQDSLWQVVGRRSAGADHVRMEVSAVLVAEADNPYDPNAVSVWVWGRKVGYLSRDDARRYRPGLLALEDRYGKPIALAGAIVGGGIRADGPGRLGLFLDHDPADFGLRAPAPPRPSGSRMWSGLSDALATDEVDDTYDLSWINDLPADDLRAIKMLRELLERESDILDRHFMYAHLEALLYRSRGVFRSALDEYDQTCRRHDAEMDDVRDAFVAKWGEVPVLETYRQMAIRQQKANNFQKALWWAERGLVLYAGDCARPEAVEDLQQRAESYRAKLHPQPRPARPKVKRPEQSQVEVLTCASCGRDFQRARVRGRKPLHCPQCRDEAE
jgi:HIRAN domain